MNDGKVRQIVNDWYGQGEPFRALGAGSRVWRAGEGEPVLCVHGVPASAFLYRKLLAELAQRGMQGVAVDLPGLGMAERPADFDYSWSGLSHWLDAAVEELGLTRFHLVVHDIGGPIGFDLIRRNPGRIQSLTVLNTFVRVSRFKRPWVMEPFARPGIGRLYLATMNGVSFPRLMRWQGVASPVPTPELQAYVALLKREDGGRAFLRIMRGFERTREFEARIVAALRERQFPARLVWGESDPALRLDQFAPDLQEVLRVDQVHRVPGKHFVQEDSPAEIAAHVAACTA